MIKIVIMLFLLSGCGVTQVIDRTSNGQAILIRSPQPNAADLHTLYEQYGIRTVVNLRGENPNEAWFEEERIGVEAIGAKWVHLRISGRSEPSPETVTKFLNLVEESENWPILIHCQGGIHRTGFIAALYRIQCQGWSPSSAIHEMEDHYFDWTILNRDALKRWLLHYKCDPNRATKR